MSEVSPVIFVGMKGLTGQIPAMFILLLSHSHTVTLSLSRQIRKCFQFGDNLAQIKFQHFIKIVCTPVAQKSNFELCLIFKIKSLEKMIGRKKISLVGSEERR